jgi:hypothetical protein
MTPDPSSTEARYAEALPLIEIGAGRRSRSALL